MLAECVDEAGDWSDLGAEEGELGCQDVPASSQRSRSCNKYTMSERLTALSSVRCSDLSKHPTPALLYCPHML